MDRLAILVGFEGCPVLALDTEQYYDADWFYDSPLSRQPCAL